MSEKCMLLLLASNSDDSRDARADEEIRKIDETVHSANNRGSFQPISRSALQFPDIASLLNRYKPNILHLGGHARATDGLVLEEDNRKVTVKCDRLADLILSSVEDDRLRLVFLSFCNSEACATAISAKVPYAVGVRGEISVESIPFSQVFYHALASGRSVEGAFNNARDTLRAKGLAEAEAWVLRVRPGTRADVPFLEANGFLAASVEQVPQDQCKKISADTDSLLSELSTTFLSQLNIAGYVKVEEDERRAVYLDDGLYVHRNKAEDATAKFIADATAEPQNGKWLSIVGDAGHGKSSLLWYLFSDLSTNPSFTVIPFLAQIESDLAEVVKTVAQVRSQGRLIVLIDTLDLLVGVNDQRLAKAISELKALGALVITNSRRQEADQLGRLVGSNKRVELRRYNDEEAQRAIRNLVRIYYPDKSESEQQEQFDEVWGLVEQQRDIRELDLEPLILRMLFEAYVPEPIPREINTQQVYQHYWDKVVLSDRVVKKPEEPIKRDQMCRHIARKVAFGDTHTDKFLIDSLQTTAGDSSPYSTIEGLVSSGVLQWGKGKSSIRFFHQTFLEFTAAYDLLSAEPHSLQEHVNQLIDDVAAFNFFRAPVLKQLTIQSFAGNPELHLRLMSELRRVNNELAAQLALEIIGKVPFAETSEEIVRQWINEEPEILRSVICETVRHYPKSKTELALDLLEAYVTSNKETAIYSICRDTFSRTEPEIVQRFLHRRLARVIEANDDTKTYFKNALCAVAKYGATSAIDDLLELFPTVKPGQQAAILDGIAEVVSAETAPQVERVIRNVIDLLPGIPGDRRNEVWDSLCRLAHELNRVSPATAKPIAHWLIRENIWRRDTNTALFIGRIVGPILADVPMVDSAIDELRSNDHLARIFNTGLLANVSSELSQHIMALILRLDQKEFSKIACVRALFEVVSGLSDIDVKQLLEFLSRWTWPTSGIGNPLAAIIKRLGEMDPQGTKHWLLKQLRQQPPHVKVIRALTILIRTNPDVFTPTELNEVYETSFAIPNSRQVFAAAVGAIATVDRELAQAMFDRLFSQGKDCQINLINSLVHSLESVPDFALHFGPRIIEVSLKQHIPGLLDNYLVTLKATPRQHSALLLSHLDSWFTDAVTRQQNEKILGELLALLKVTAEAHPDMSFRISQRIPIISKGVAGGLAALYDNVSEHGDTPELLGSVLQAVAKVANYDQLRMRNALNRTLPRLAQRLGSARVIEMVMAVYKTIENEQSLKAFIRAALEIPGWGPKEDAALLADKDLPAAVRSLLTTRTRR